MEENKGIISFRSTTPFNADENFVLSFEYDADEGLTIGELTRMFRAFAAAYGYSNELITKAFANIWDEN